jgi:hypothetical protein
MNLLLKRLKNVNKLVINLLEYVQYLESALCAYRLHYQTIYLTNHRTMEVCYVYS